MVSATGSRLIGAYAESGAVQSLPKKSGSEEGKLSSPAPFSGSSDPAAVVTISAAALETARAVKQGGQPSEADSARSSTQAERPGETRKNDGRRQPLDIVV